MVSRVLNLLLQDKIALYMALVVRLGVLLAAKPLAVFLRTEHLSYALLIISFILTIFVELFAADCAHQMIVRKRILVGQTLADNLRRFLPALFFGAVVPLLAGLAAGVPVIMLLGVRLGTVLLLPLLFLLGICETIFPVIYILSASPIYKIYYLLANYLRRNLRHALQTLSFILLTAFIFNAASVLLQKLPHAEVLIALLGGLQTVFVIYGLVILFLGRNQVSELV